MISHGEGFVLRHRSGRYLSSRAYFVTIGNRGCHDPNFPMVMIFELVARAYGSDLVAAGDYWTRFLAVHPWTLVADQFEVVPGPGCGCCGEGWGMTWVGGIVRCHKHVGRNPCAIEGCKKTRAASESGGLGDDQWLCSEHWRRYVPPRSARRRAYHAFFRKAKRDGWSPKLKRQFWRYWARLVSNARSKHADGSINKSEIERLFGWAD